MKMRASAISSFVGILALTLALALVPTPASAQFTWNGGGGDDLWSTDANWGGSHLTEAGDAILNFGGSTRLSPIKDLNGGSGGFNVDTITFLSGAGSFNLLESGSNGVDMLGTRTAGTWAPIINNSANTQTIDLKLIARKYSGILGLQFDTAAGNINVTGLIAALENAGISKVGSHTLTLSHNNTYQGLTEIEDGVVSITDGGALGDLTNGTTINQANDARLDLSGNINVAEDLTFINTSPGLATTLRNASGDNEISGLVTLPGNIRMQSAAGSLEVSGGVNGANTFFVVNSTGGSTTFTTNPINIGNGTFWADSGGLTVLAVAGNAWNNTTFTSGTLRMDVANALPANTTFRHSGLSYGTGGTLDLNGFDQTVGSLYTGPNLANAAGSDITSATPATLTVNQSGDTTYYGTFSGVAALTKSGAGKLTLGGDPSDTSNTSTGLTTVSGGTLYLAKQGGALAVSGDVLVDGGRLEPTQNNQIADTSTITVDSGLLWHNKTDTVANVTINSASSGSGFHLLNGLNITGTLEITAGDAIAGSGGSATAAAVNMTGGKLAMAANGGNSTINIGSGGLTMSGATVQLGYTPGGTPTAQVNLGGDFTGSGTNSITYTNTDGPRLLDLQGATRTFNVTSGTTTISPTIQNGGLTKTGAGTLTLSGSLPNTYTGPTTVDGGTLSLNKSSGVNAVPGDVTVNNSGKLILAASHQIPDTADITANDAAVFSSENHPDTVHNVTLNSSNSDPNVNKMSNLNITGTLMMTQGVAGLNSGTNTTAGTVNMSGGSRIEFAANTANTTLNIGSGGLTMSGATLRFGWTAPVLGSPFTARVNLGGDFTGSGTNSLEYVTTNGPRLLDLQAATRTFDITSGTTTVDVDLQNGGLVKDGPGTLVFNGNNTYAGTTTVSDGTLLVDGTHTGGGAYTVQSGATLGGTGTIGADVAFQGGSFAAPGTSPGTLSVDGNLTMADGSTYLWELGPAGASDTIDLTGDLTLVDSWTLTVLDDGGKPFPGQKHYLFTGFSSLTPAPPADFNVNFDLSQVPEWATYTDLSELMIVQDSQGLYLTGLASVPEPASLGLLALGALVLAGCTRRRGRPRR